MTTLTIQINKKTKSGKAVFDLLTEMSKDGKALKVIDNIEKSPYNPEFVKKIKQAEKRGEYTVIDTDDIWGSLGLK
jgi:anti-sigma28 factor (negative regulator of flagellin synthesis)